MGRHYAIVWTPAMDALVGTASDAKVGAALGIAEDRVRYRRQRRNLPTYRSSRAKVTVACANCGTTVERPRKAVARSARLYCTRLCADVGQKTRDEVTLRYGPGWKATRQAIRERDKVCRVCGKTPEQNGQALQVNHLIPFRFGGTNHPENLVALCDSCHHRVDAMVTKALRQIIDVSVVLDGSSLTVSATAGDPWHGSALPANSPTEAGSTE